MPHTDAATALIASALNRPVEEVAEVLKDAAVWRRWTDDEIADMSPVHLATAIGECHAAGVHVPEWIFDAAKEYPAGKYPDNLVLELPPEQIAEVKAYVSDHAADGCLRDYIDGLEKAHEWRRVCLGLHTVSQTGKVDLKYSAIAEYVIHRLEIISYKHDAYIYQPDRGIFVPNNSEIEQIVIRIAREVGFDGRITQATREVLHYVLNTEMYREYPFNYRTDLIPVKNGVVSIDYERNEVVLIPHSPEYRFTYQLPVKYDPAASPEFVLKVLREWVAEEDVPVLVQLPAQALLQAQRQTFKKAYLFEGPKNAGKTTYYEFIQAFFGTENVTLVDLQALCSGKSSFSTASLEHKIINYDDEMETFPLKYNGAFKKLTGSIFHRIERKFKDPIDNALVFCVHAFSCNKPPAVKELDDEAFWTRWLYVIFPNVFDVVPGFKRRLETPENFSGFLNLVLAMMIEIMTTGGGKLLHTMDEEEVKDRWVRATNALYVFVEEHTVRRRGSFIIVDDFYRGFVEYCDQAGQAVPGTKQRITTMLGSMKIHSKEKKIRKGSPVRVYEDLAWTDETPFYKNALTEGGNQREIF